MRLLNKTRPKIISEEDSDGARSLAWRIVCLEDYLNVDYNAAAGYGKQEDSKRQYRIIRLCISAIGLYTSM